MPVASSPSRRALLLFFTAVVLSFVAATTYSEYRTQSVRRAADQIATNAVPSIQHLAAARANLRDLHRVAEEHVLRMSLGEALDGSEIRLRRERLNAELEKYYALPTFPQERDLWKDIKRGNERLDVALGRLEDNVEAHEIPAAEWTLLQEVAPAADETASVLMRAIQFNADRAHDEAVAVEEARRSGLAIAFALDGVSVLIALLVGWVVWNWIRRYERLLDERAQELDMFAGRMAHDVLNPISAAQVGLAIFEKKLDLMPAELAPTVRRTTKSLQRAGTLVQDLLEFARAGAHPDPKARTSVTDVLPSVIEELQPLAAERAVDLLVQSEYSGAVACPESVLASLISNLTRNAIKYIGRASERRVAIRVMGQNGVVRFEVEDTGPGLPSSLADRVFEPFVRGEEADEPGTGLGLATVKRLAQAHGGEVGVHPAPDHGSVFWFELPRS